MKILFLGFALLIFSQRVYAFPEMVRHGYVNCTSCHMSATGGGLLTEYGRSLSKELLSSGRFFFEREPEPVPTGAPSEAATVKPEQDENFLKGTVKLPKGVDLGGDIRFLQYIKDNKKETVGKFIAMQGDLEVSYSDGKRFQLMGTIGRVEPREKAKKATEYIASRRHWASVRMGQGDEKDLYQMRVGKFFPAYGIYIPEHNMVNRAGLGFDQLLETYNLEFAYVGADWNFFGTYVFGRPDDKLKPQEEGVAVQVSRSIGDTYKVGVSGMSSRDTNLNSNPKKNKAGLFGILGFTPKVYSLVDANYTQDAINGSGFLNYTKIGYEFAQGVHALATQEYLKTSIGKPKIWRENYGIGLQYFPRVHWDFLTMIRQERNTATTRDFDTVLWVLFHYYL